jgi:hypothetical protein
MGISNIHRTLETVKIISHILIGDLAAGDASFLTELQKSAATTSPAMRNHGGGHYNHALFWVTGCISGQRHTLVADIFAGLMVFNMDMFFLCRS